MQNGTVGAWFGPDPLPAGAGLGRSARPGERGDTLTFQDLRVMVPFWQNAFCPVITLASFVVAPTVALAAQVSVFPSPRP